MLEANKSALFEKIFAIYNRNLLKRHFYSIQIKGLDFLLNRKIKLPVIIYCNHSSWWDGLVAFQISYKTGLDGFIMMEERQLRKYHLFRKLGAFSIVREKPREAFKSIIYASTILKKNVGKTALWIFPQGEILPNDSRPIRFYGGLSKIIEKTAECSVLSMATRYEFLGEFKPRIFVRIEKPEHISADKDFNAKKMTEKFADCLTENLDALKKDINHRNLEGFESIL